MENTIKQLTVEQATKMVEAFEKSDFAQKKLADAKAMCANILDKLGNFTDSKNKA